MTRLSNFVAALAYTSLFGLSWMMLLDRVEISVRTGFFWFFFFAVALLSSAVSVTPEKQTPTEILRRNRKR